VGGGTFGYPGFGGGDFRDEALLWVKGGEDIEIVGRFDGTERFAECFDQAHGALF
jgi:hypothetical protein